MIKIKESDLQNISFEMVSIETEDTELDMDSVQTGIDEHETFYRRWAYGPVEYKAQHQGQTLELMFTWQADAPPTTRLMDSYGMDVDVALEPNEKMNFVIVDDDGDAVDYSIDEIERDACHFEDFRSFADLPEPEEDEVIVENEVIKMNEAEEFVVERDNGPNLKFTGEKIGFATSKDTYNDGGRWFDLRLFRTIGGKYVCTKTDVTCWQGEHNRHAAVVCETLDEVKDFFGYGWVSKELYDDAGIEILEEVE